MCRVSRWSGSRKYLRAEGFGNQEQRRLPRTRDVASGTRRSELSAYMRMRTVG